MQNNLKVRLIIGFILVFGVFLLGGLWFREATSPVLPDSFKSQIFVIAKGESPREIAQKLKEQNLIRSPLAFFLVVRQKGLAKKIQAGDFKLSPSMSALEIAEEFTHGTLDLWVTIPEGWRNGQIAMQLIKQLNISESDFLRIAQEGYMFPDTYLIPKDALASDIVAILKANFDKKVKKEWGSEDIIILASIVEREAKFDKDRPIVAGILSNRLKLNMPLQADATLQYIKGYDEISGSWWSQVSPKDKEIDSLYNTYKYSGLPPGPIANPGLTSIKAAANPSETDYLYYISEPDGTMHYAKTLEEHNANIREYLR